MLLKGKTAVITGANRGIGLAILTGFAEHGANIYAITRAENNDFLSKCDELSNKYNITITHIYADFSEEEQVKAAAKKILSDKTAIDILVNNVGIGYPLCMFTMTKPDKLRKAFEINFFSSIFLTQQLSRNMMKKRGGSIIFISSSAAFDGGANLEYSASKAAIIGASRRMAYELGKYGIRVNALAPGLTDTDMGNSMSEEDEEIALSRNIFGRKAKPEEIADAVTFLASDMSSFITKQVLCVDGGLLK